MNNWSEQDIEKIVAGVLAANARGGELGELLGKD